jgi:pimeloyl-ACP methyl ester carboxylesterase
MSPGKASSSPRVWFTGHSDGTQLAQLAALKHASEFGADSVGGVLLFGPSRVGSVGFAKFFNSVLGDRTVYYAYGRDPASATDYTMADVRGGARTRAGGAWGSSQEVGAIRGGRTAPHHHG